MNQEVDQIEPPEAHTEVVGRAVSCPRCGYDQRGPISTWVESCPLTGTCTECGLEFQWSRVLMAHKFEPRWCVEFASPFRRVLWACMATLLRSFHPCRFWSRLNMSQRIRSGRLFIYLAFLLLPLLLTYLAVQTSMALYVRSMVEQDFAASGSTLAAQLTQLQAILTSLNDPAQYSDLTDEVRQQTIGSIQARIAAVQGQIAQSPGYPQSLIPSHLDVVLEMVFRPLAQSSSLMLTSPSGYSGPYAAPLDVLGVVITDLNVNRASNPLPDEFFRLCLFGFIMGLLLILITPASFILLPISRRRAKVRWSHIARVLIYGMFMPMVIIWLWIGHCGLMLLAPNAPAVPTDWIIRMCIFGLPVLLWLWWSAAISRYLRMPHGVTVAASLVIMGSLLCLGLTWAIAPRAAMAVFDFLDFSI